MCLLLEFSGGKLFFIAELFGLENFTEYSPSLWAFKFHKPPNVETVRSFLDTNPSSITNLVRHLAPLMQFSAIDPSVLNISTDKSTSGLSGGRTLIS